MAYMSAPDIVIPCIDKYVNNKYYNVRKDTRAIASRGARQTLVHTGQMPRHHAK